MLRSKRLTILLVIVASAIAATPGADERSITAKIVGTDFGYANINTDATHEQLQALGIELGSRFAFEHDGTRRLATFVADYTSVPDGEWLGLLDNNTLKLAISFGQACPEIACATGDTVIITKAGDRE